MTRGRENAGWRAASVAVVSAAVYIVCVASALAAESLFPAPLHLTRQVDDPISGGSWTVEEYYLANRAISIRGSLVAIADYERSELTVIDRARGTYSVESFTQLGSKRSTAKSAAWTSGPVTPREVNGRPADLVEARSGEVSVALALDRQVFLPRAAIDVVTGEAWPGTRGPVSEVLDAHSSRSRVSSNATDSREERETLPLPIEQIVSYAVAGERLVARSVVVRVGSELAPPELIAIPAGAKRVESDGARRESITRELDSLKVTP